MTKTEIDAIYKEQHDNLSDAFYSKKHSTGVTTKEQADFDAAHLTIMINWEQALIDNNLKPMDNTKGEYAAATDKLDFIARRLGLV